MVSGVLLVPVSGLVNRFNNGMVVGVSCILKIFSGGFDGENLCEVRVEGRVLLWLSNFDIRNLVEDSEDSGNRGRFRRLVDSEGLNLLFKCLEDSDLSIF